MGENGSVLSDRKYQNKQKVKGHGEILKNKRESLEEIDSSVKAKVLGNFVAVNIKLEVESKIL